MTFPYFACPFLSELVSCSYSHLKPVANGALELLTPLLSSSQVLALLPQPVWFWDWAQSAVHRKPALCLLSWTPSFMNKKTTMHLCEVCFPFYLLYSVFNNSLESINCYWKGGIVMRPKKTKRGPTHLGGKEQFWKKQGSAGKKKLKLLQFTKNLFLNHISKHLISVHLFTRQDLRRIISFNHLISMEFIN